MTTAHAFYYLLVVLVVTTMAYLYTSEADAPTHQSDEVPAVEDTTSTSSDVTTPTEVGLPKPDSSSDTASPQVTLVGSAWRWQGLIDTNGEVLFSPRRPEAFMLEFTESGMSSRTDCNTVGGTYQIEGDTLTFGELMSTLMFCEDSDETIYVTSLQNVASFEEEAKILKLILKDGSYMLFVSRIP